ncbi:hypothetical protein B7P43_G05314 [Cryptotermes secundus]|uniref:Endonuclease/exonuclease/phosphatase domain-containing protein n=1 Tax=Cryptotermes secundus TaxID=105785 RepID=A0A2J7QFB5_9NEOP|nr:hypothetical protein B7P43_G05314 [Cryptotermes secundus]
MKYLGLHLDRRLTWSTHILAKTGKDRFYKELEHVFDKFLINAKVGREDIFKPTMGYDNGVRAVNFATSKNLTVTVFPHRNIHKFTWTSPDGKIHNQIDHILIDRRRHSSILDVLSFRAADCDTDHYLVVAKVRKRLAVSKQTTHRVQMERFSLKHLNEVNLKSSIVLKSQIGSQLWKTWKLRWMLIKLGKLLERI